MEVLTTQEFLISICIQIVFTCIFICIFNLDICLEIVGGFIRRIGCLFKRAKDWIWWKTHKKDDLTQDLPSGDWGFTSDEASEAWRKAMEFEAKAWEELNNGK